VTAIVLIIVLALIVVFGVVILSRRRGFSKNDHQFFAKKWKIIHSQVKDNPAKSILDADKLLDLAMKKKGFSGTLGEKLKKAKTYFSSINDVWDAHKLRNRIAHEVGCEVNHARAVEALRKFKKALHDLGLKL
jgi:hypothetical protein